MQVGWNSTLPSTLKEIFQVGGFKGINGEKTCIYLKIHSFVQVFMLDISL